MAHFNVFAKENFVKHVMKTIIVLVVMVFRVQGAQMKLHIQ